MFIGICGTICAGKKSVANILVSDFGFKEIHWIPLPDKLRTSRANPILEHTGTLEVHGFTEPIGDPSDHKFVGVESVANFVTKRWKERWVTTELYDVREIEVLLRRPFFTLLSIDAPILKRFERFADQKAKGLSKYHIAETTLNYFVQLSDSHLLYCGVAPLMERAEIHLINPTSSLQALRKSVMALDLTNELERRIRPDWDQYFMGLASLAAQRSNCMKRRVGCVLVRDRRVISTGYNGTPRNMKNCNEGGCPRCNNGDVGLSTCLCIHAEENALLEAGRERIREGSILYCDTCPCLTCSIKIVQVGISEVVYNQSYSMDDQAAAILKEGGVQLRQFSPPLRGLIDLSMVEAKR